MKPPLRLHATPALARRYKQLLRTRWTEGSLAEAVSLSREVAGMPVGYLDPGEAPSARSKAPAKGYPIPVDASSYLREFLERANSSLPSVPESFPVHRQRARQALWQQAHELAVLLCAETWCVPRGDVALFRDARSVAWHCSLEFLLPDMFENGMRAEHDYVINAMAWFASAVWQDSPSQHAYLRACLHGYLAENEQADAWYRSALELTPTTEHEYLTLAHAFWFHLQDTGRRAEAEQFLYQLHRLVPADQAPEVEEMIRQQLRPPAVA